MFVPPRLGGHKQQIFLKIREKIYVDGEVERAERYRTRWVLGVRGETVLPAHSGPPPTRSSPPPQRGLTTRTGDRTNDSGSSLIKDLNWEPTFSIVPTLKIKGHNLGVI